MEQTRSGIIQLQFIVLNGQSWRYPNDKNPAFKRMYPTSGWQNISFKPESPFHCLLSSSKPAFSKTGESFDIIDSVCVFDSLEELQRHSRDHWSKLKYLTEDAVKYLATLNFASYLGKYLWAHGKVGNVNRELVKVLEQDLHVGPTMPTVHSTVEM